MKALVTGGAGFIGSHLVDRLLDDGHAVTVVDRHPARPVDRRAITHRVRLQDWDPGYGFDVVFHLAGPVGPVGVLSQAGRIVPEVVGMAEALRGYRCPVIFVSTSEVYGAQTLPIAEDAPRIIAAGHSARMEYAVAKLAAETMLLNARGMDVRIVRPFNVAGPRQRTEGGFVLPRFIEQARRGERLTVYGDGSQRRAFTHVADIVDGLLAVWQRAGPGSVWNLGNPANESSILELAERVVDVLGVSPWGCVFIDPVELWGPDFREAPDKVPDITRATTLLGWLPWRGIEQTIRDAAA